ncbi:MAG: hypothetical protein ACRD2N_23595 [Vicinamibacterales bacterium]
MRIHDDALTRVVVYIEIQEQLRERKRYCGLSAEQFLMMVLGIGLAAVGVVPQ